jgi:hypothetical protein
LPAPHGPFCCCNAGLAVSGGVRCPHRERCGDFIIHPDLLPILYSWTRTIQQRTTPRRVSPSRRQRRDVLAWLRDLGFERYEAAFRENDVSAEVLRHINADDLKDLGDSAVGHRRQLLVAIDKLRDNAASISTAGDWFTEGFDTRDLLDAKALLAQLG